MRDGFGFATTMTDGEDFETTIRPHLVGERTSGEQRLVAGIPLEEYAVLLSADCCVLTTSGTAVRGAELGDYR